MDVKFSRAFFSWFHASGVYDPDFVVITCVIFEEVQEIDRSLAS